MVLIMLSANLKAQVIEPIKETMNTRAQLMQPIEQRMVDVKYGVYQNGAVRIQNTFNFLDDGVGISVAYQYPYHAVVDENSKYGFSGGLNYTTEWLNFGFSMGSLGKLGGRNDLELGINAGVTARASENFAITFGAMLSKTNGVGAEAGIGILF